MVLGPAGFKVSAGGDGGDGGDRGDDQNSTLARMGE